MVQFLKFDRAEFRPLRGLIPLLVKVTWEKLVGNRSFCVPLPVSFHVHNDSIGELPKNVKLIIKVSFEL